MHNPDLRHIMIIIDRSGSMQAVKNDTEGGLRAFLDTQRQAPGHTFVTLHQFDDRHETVYHNVPLADVADFTLEPRGMTALLDAVGSGITRLSADLAGLREDDRPGEVIVVILTDGQENASREYTIDQVKELITARQDMWRFVFLGADQDAFVQASAMGIGHDTTLSYSSDNTTASMTSAGAMITRGSRSGRFTFTDDERDQTAR